MVQFLGLRRLVSGRRHDENSYPAGTKPRRKRDRLRSNRLVVMMPSQRDTVSELCRVFSRDSGDGGSDGSATYHTATPDVSWDESSSSIWTALRPCLKVFSQDESLRFSYYDQGGFDTLSYRVDFAAQKTVYYHELTVSELRGPRDEKIPTSPTVKPFSISMQPDPWQVVLCSTADVADAPARKAEKRNIGRWGRSTRERLWQEFCQESQRSKLEKEKRLLEELRLAEKDLNDITSIVYDNPEQYKEQARQLEETLDAMEQVW